MIERLAWVLCLVFSTAATASGPIHDLPVAQSTTLERYVHDLVGTDASDRLYAAREILRRVRRADRLAGREEPDIEVLEARQRLTDFDRLVAPKCIRQLAMKNVRRPCAIILGILETREAAAPLESALATETRDRCRRAIQTALDQIRAEGDQEP